jgi:uncharacterized membrane protein
MTDMTNPTSAEHQSVPHHEHTPAHPHPPVHPSSAPQGTGLVPGLATNRIETLADGVFAIVMTLLVFGITVPASERVADIGLGAALLELAPNFVSYVISFVILGVYWVGHHNQFFWIKRSNRTLLWINIFFLMFVSLIPFSAGLLSRYGSEALTIIIYDFNLIICGLMLYVHWHYATDKARLSREVPEHIQRMVRRRILIPPLFYFGTVLLSPLSPGLSIFVDILIPLLYIFPSAIDVVFHPHKDD